MRTVKRRGGFFQAFRTAVAIARREGFRGVTRKLASLGHEFSSISTEAFDRNDYPEWIRRYDSLSDSDLASMRSEIESFTLKPLVSIVMPTYNSDAVWLGEAIESIQGQIYPYWELCIADDCSTDESLKRLLLNYAVNDSRIKVRIRRENGHISAASNTAIASAEGEWIALVDHDDIISKNALFHVVKCINNTPAVRLIYSDEDKIGPDGERFSPYFKSDWNPDLFYTRNLVCHLGVYHRELVEEVGGFRKGLEGAQDYDLALRCLEKIEEYQVLHIPRILYHWRSHQNSTAQSRYSKPYAESAGQRALSDHFSKTDKNVRVECVGSGYRVHYPVPAPEPLVTLIIPLGEKLGFLQRCVQSIVGKTQYSNYKILLIGSTFGGSEGGDGLGTLTELSQVDYMEFDSGLGEAASINRAVAESGEGLIGIITADIEILSANWLVEMVSHAVRPEIGAVGGKLISDNNRVFHGGYVLSLGPNGVAGHPHFGERVNSPGYFGRMEAVSTVAAVSLDCLLVGKAIFKEAGGLDESGLPGKYLDIDFCLRLSERGLRNIFDPFAQFRKHRLILDEMATKKPIEDVPARYMQEHWSHCLEHDFFYSPNLTLRFSDFSLAWPPRIEGLFEKYSKKEMPEPMIVGQELAVVIHVYYLDVFESLFDLLVSTRVKLKLFVTTSRDLADHLREMLNHSIYKFEILVVENRGRDVLPFLKMMPEVIAEGYGLVLKLHTKKSTTRVDGDVWREDIYKNLLSPVGMVRALEYMHENTQVGIIGPTGHVLPLASYFGRNKARVIRLAAEMGVNSEQLRGLSFVAGSMFFVRVSALQPLLNLSLDDEFEPESGQTDGTMAHAVERVFPASLLSLSQQLMDTNLQKAELDLKKDYKYTDA
jgi:glycosyltransferase involved in cell wall biosynthesis